MLRACAMTLIVLLEESDDAQAVREILALLMRDHPSRAVVVSIRDSSERLVAAEVRAQCWMPFGKREQICCEQIEITASRGATGDLVALLPPLAAPDLPVFIWCRAESLFDIAAGLPGTALIDSTHFSTPAAAFARLVAPSPKPARDLAWTRLTRWRELVAQLFENQRYRGCMAKATAVRIQHTGRTPPAHGWYLAAWLLNGLEKSGSRPALEFISQAGAGDGLVTGLEIVAGEAAQRSFSISQTEAGAAEIRVDSLVNRTVFEAPTDYSLLREELSIAVPDPVYRETLARAVKMLS